MISFHETIKSRFNMYGSNTIDQQENFASMDIITELIYPLV